MHTSTRSARRVVSSLVALAPFAFACYAHAQTPQTFTPKGIVKWAQGGEREKAMLAQMGYGHLAQGQFGLSVADLNSDGRPEIIVLSMSACDGSGCPVAALQNAGASKVNQIFAQKVAGRLAITNETVNGFYAFAAADQTGAIMKDAAGRALVYPVGGAAAQANTAPAARPATPPTASTGAGAAAAAATPPAAAAARPPAPAATTAPAAVPPRPSIPPERLALVTGEGKPDWRTPGAEYLPVCTWPICLNPKVTEKTGVGTEKATVRGDVTQEDAQRWCSIHKSGYKFCAEEEVANNGTRGGLYGRRFDAKGEANCAAGTMRAIDGGNYAYAGTWPEGGPGAGRARFSAGGRPVQFFEQQGLVQVNNGAKSFREVSYEPGSGESLAIQWEILCKGSPPPKQ